MDVLVITYAVLTILSGVTALILAMLAAVIGKRIEHISYLPRSENETEYGLRTLLFMYPNAQIDTIENEISIRLMIDNPRITVHQET